MIAVLAMMALCACGARSGLDVPRREAGALADVGVPSMDARVPPIDAGPPPCPLHVVLERAAAEVVLVLDRSGSMGGPLGTSSITRTEALRAALASTLPAIDDRIALGALLYPIATAGSRAVCDVPPSALAVPVARDSAPAVLAALDAHPADGGTPTADALARAYDALRGRPAPAVILATDGGPNCDPADRGQPWYGVAPESCIENGIPVERCVDDERTLEVIEGGRAAGVPTYVIGMDVSLPLLVEVLDRMAIAGGRARPGAPRFYDAARPEGIADALQEIAGEVSGCAFVAGTIDPSRGTVHVDGAPFDGWELGPAGTIELGEDACDRAREPGAVVTFGPRCDG